MCVCSVSREKVKEDSLRLQGVSSICCIIRYFYSLLYSHLWTERYVIFRLGLLYNERKYTKLIIKVGTLSVRDLRYCEYRNSIGVFISRLTTFLHHNFLSHLNTRNPKSRFPSVRPNNVSTFVGNFQRELFSTCSQNCLNIHIRLFKKNDRKRPDFHVSERLYSWHVVVKTMARESCDFFLFLIDIY